MGTIVRRDFLARSAALTGGTLLPFANFVHAQPPPEKIIAQGTDWRFLNELKQELKA